MNSLYAKSCIVTTHNGIEVARKRAVVEQQHLLPAAYEAVRAKLAAQYPDHYIFCDASEGVEVKEPPVTVRPTRKPVEDLPPAIAMALGAAQERPLQRKVPA